jgi:hypothetical protein
VDKFSIKIGRWILSKKEISKPYIKIGRWILHVGVSSGCACKAEG